MYQAHQIKVPRVPRKGKGMLIGGIAFAALLMVGGAIGVSSHRAETRQKAEAERRALVEEQKNVEAERLARETADRLAEEQRQARVEEQQKAERLAREETERVAQAESKREAEARRIAQEEAERQAQAAASPLANGKIGDERKFPIGAGEEILIKYVPGGRFQMGSPRGEAGRGDDENQVWVTLSSHFWMAETEVTQGQWAAVMGSNPSHFKGGDWKKLPVESVSWNDAQSFITKLNTESPPGGGWTWALPTEAQWERACRGGTTTATAFGNSLSSRQANFDGDYPYGGAARGPYLQKTVSVKRYQPNAYGLYDMHGNVWEWCADGYQGKLPGGEDPLVSAGAIRVFRGGSWRNYGRYCRSSTRNRFTPGYRDQDNGFRLAAVPAGRAE